MRVYFDGRVTLQWAKALKDEISLGNLKTELGGLGTPDRAEIDPSIGAKACLAIVERSRAEDTGRFRNIYVEGSKKYDRKDIV